ncbi:MAG: hypothetical protein B9S33_08985 [Pedosphaera sp. Tous-C6FEB]|nr:MAG: hypothetical protein B9S33_08985 [Pedosphaera sp. Tous-C6FEB]
MKTLVLALVCSASLLTLAACRRKAPPAVVPATPAEAQGQAAPAAPAAPVDPASIVPAEPGSAAHASLEMLTFAVQQFQGKKGRLPNDLNELAAAGLIPSVPKPPVGQRYVIDAQKRQVVLVR